MAAKSTLLHKQAGVPLAVLVSLGVVACGGGGDGDGGLVNRGHTVAGTVTVPAGTAIDSDTNDPNATFTTNDTVDSAQTVPAPVQVGGFLTASGTGNSGDRFASDADPRDVYAVPLTDGESVTLFITDSDTADLDLYLFRADGETLVESSESATADTETVTADADENYIVVVEAASGTSNYVLNVATGALSTTQGYNAAAEFVPGELIVRFRDEETDRSLPMSAALMAQQMGLKHKAGGAGRPMLLDLGDHLQTLQAFNALGIEKAPGQLGARMHLPAKVREKLATVQVAKALSTREDVAYVGLNHIYQPQLIPNDEYYDYQWHYPQISLPRAWDQSLGDGVIVAVVDTGIYPHPDLAGQVTDNGYDFISDPERALDGDGIDDDPTDPGDGFYPDGSSTFHGTHVAGTIAAASNNGTGVAGVAWNARIMPIRALGAGGGTTYDVLQGMRYAAGMTTDAGVTPPAQPAEIINLSLGGPGGGTMGEAYREVRDGPDGVAGTDDDVLIIAAAGNGGNDTPNYPAAYDAVVSVSATDAANDLTPYSSFGPTVALAAPGGDMTVDVNNDGRVDGVLSTAVDDSGSTTTTGYSFQNGTSMACPHVAGVAALMEAIYDSGASDMSPDEFEGALAQGSLTDDISGDGATTRNEQFGYGLINAQKAVDWAIDGTLSPLVSVSPPRLDFDSVTDSLTFTVSNATSTDDELLGDVTVTTSEPWLSVSASNTQSNGAGEYSATVDRNGLGDGRYSATVNVATTMGGDKDIPVVLQVGTLAQVADAGLHYIILADAGSGRVVHQVVVNATNGEYPFRFEGVEDGRYLLYAGSDLDNDLQLCDPGEACGAYPSLSELTPVSVFGDRTGLRFTSQYRLNLGATNANLGREQGNAATQLNRR